MLFLLFQQFHIHPFDLSCFKGLKTNFLIVNFPVWSRWGETLSHFDLFLKWPQGSSCVLAVRIKCPTLPPLQALSMTINRSSPGGQISGIFLAFFLKSTFNLFWIVCSLSLLWADVPTTVHLYHMQLVTAFTSWTRLSLALQLTASGLLLAVFLGIVS